MNRPSKPTPPPEDARTIFLDLSTPVVATPPAVDRLLEKGSTVHSRFRLLELIGEGSTSRIYKAVDLRKAEAGSLDTHVAIKLLKAPLGNNGEAMEFLARLLKGLHAGSHPNIARVMECDHDGDTAFLSMELLSARPLTEKMRDSKGGVLPRDEALRIVEGVANALEFAHARNIPHGDLKPGNILLTDSGVTKVTDFGLARVTGRPIGTPRPASNNTTRSMKALSLTYASPEMLELGDPDPRDDVFALGCLAWELMTGEHPFKGKVSTMAREAGMTLTCPSQFNEQEFSALSRALEFSRAKRPLSVRQFMAEFRGGGSSSSWRLAAGIGLLVVGVLAVAAFFAFKTPSNKVPPDAAANFADTAPTSFPAGTSFRDCANCPLMKVLPPGQFLQGSTPDDPDAQPYEMPQHNVSIGYPVAAGMYEVTVGQFAQYVADTGADLHGCSVYDGEWHTSAEVSWKNAIEGQTPSHPVSCVSWQDAKRYAAWLSQRTHHLYRLPSASEWEYAARGGATAAVPWTEPSGACTFGNLADQTAAQRYPGWTVQPCADKFVQAAPVGSFEPNAMGLYDMLGNVFEWVEDCWADDYAGAPSDGSARTDADCSQRELRGGSWFTQPSYVRTAYRDRFPIEYRSTSVGFRLIREINE